MHTIGDRHSSIVNPTGHLINQMVHSTTLTYQTSKMQQCYFDAATYVCLYTKNGNNI